MTIIDRLSDPAGVRAALDWLAAEQTAMLTAVTDWAHINSGSSNTAGLAAFTEAVRAQAQRLDAEQMLVPLAATEKVSADGTPYAADNSPALVLTRRSGANRRVLLTGHLDTVFAADHAFQRCRTLDGGHINGPGVADMKGGIAVMLWALEALQRSPYAHRVDYEVILSPDEETGSLASAPLLTERAQAADIGLTYEPALADGTLAGARKGSGNFTLVVRGRAAHAGRAFAEGRNAVVKLAAIIGDLAALTDARPGLTLNAAVVSGGTAPNIVPDLAQCRFNVRLETVADGDWVREQINACLERHQSEGFEIALYGGINRPPKVISAAGQLMMQRVRDLGSELGLDIHYVATGGCCEGNNLAAAGLPNIDTLGVRGGYIHSDREFLVPESLAERARLSALILMAFADGMLDDVIAARRRQNDSPLEGAA